MLIIMLAVDVIVALQFLIYFNKSTRLTILNILHHTNIKQKIMTDNVNSIFSNKDSYSITPSILSSH